MSQRKLLLADDSITIQKVVNLTFADEGIEVLTVGDGDSAMERLNEFKPDLIMADVNMPGLTGYQICERIKQSEDFKNTPVILLVGSFEPFDESEAQRVGADDFLTKPFQSIRQLVSKVTELLDSNKTSKTAVSSEDSTETAKDDFSTKQFSNPEMDDEMIETTPSSGFALDELQKFETKEQFEPVEDSAKTQPLSAEEFRQFSFSRPEETTESEEIIDPEATTESEETTEPDQITDSAVEPIYAEAPVETETMTGSSRPTQTYRFDEEFFLELPQDEDEEEDEAEAETLPPAVETPEPEYQDEQMAQVDPIVPESQADYSPRETEEATETQEQDKQPEFVEAGQSQAPASFIASSELSSETIDMIVRKVVERLSDKAVREIAWEVVPQMADLIVKKMAEEKLKE